MIKKVKFKKVKCKKCGNEEEFHSYGAASVDVVLKWCSKKKKYICTPTNYYLYAQDQYSCTKCGCDDVDLDNLEHSCDNLTWEGVFYR